VSRICCVGARGGHCAGGTEGGSLTTAPVLTDWRSSAAQGGGVFEGLVGGWGEGCVSELAEGEGHVQGRGGLCAIREFLQQPSHVTSTTAATHTGT
jgi:hypothetical protein